MNSMPISPDIAIGKADDDSHCYKCGLRDTQLKELKESNLKLQETNSKLEQKVGEILEQLNDEKASRHGSHELECQQSRILWESNAKDTLSSIATFTALLSEYIHSNGDNPARSFIFQQANFGDFFSDFRRTARDRHWKLLLENYVCNRLFSGFEYERFSGSVNKVLSLGDDERAMVLFLGCEERTRECLGYFIENNAGGTVGKAICPAMKELFDTLFLDYFRSLHILPSDAETLCAAFTDHNDVMASSLTHMTLGEPAENQRNCQPLLGSFITAAKFVWDFHKLCLSFEWPATIFRVARGEPFNAMYMDSIDVGDVENDERESVLRVAFMTTPGFRLGNSVIKCQVVIAPEI